VKLILISSKNQSLIQPFFKTTINTVDELEALEGKLINDQNHEFRSQLVSAIFHLNGKNHVFTNTIF